MIVVIWGARSPSATPGAMRQREETQMSQHDPSSPVGGVTPSSGQQHSSRPTARGRGEMRSIVPGLTLFCLNLALGAFLIINHVWPLGFASLSSGAPVSAAPGAVATGTLGADPIESPPAQQSPVIISLTPAPPMPIATSTPRAHSSTTAPATATPATAPAVATPTPTLVPPTPTPTLTSVG